MRLGLENMFTLRGRTALVTGGSSGIGHMIAQVFVANGVRTYITGRDVGRLREAAAELGREGECLPIEARLESMPGVEALGAALREREPVLDILVNNAGSYHEAPLDTYPEAEWDAIFALNTKAPFFLTQNLLPLLAPEEADNRFGRVINITSIRARMAEAPSLPYNGSKAATEHMTRVLARQLAPRRITVNAIAPGWFRTRMNDDFIGTRGAEMVSRIPFGRFGAAQDIGGLAAYLCSPAGAYLTGQVISVDGGLMLKA